LSAYFDILTYGKHGCVHAMKCKQHDDGKRSSGSETQSKSRKQVDEESSDVYYPMVYEFSWEKVPAAVCGGESKIYK